MKEVYSHDVIVFQLRKYVDALVNGGYEIYTAYPNEGNGQATIYTNARDLPQLDDREVIS